MIITIQNQPLSNDQNTAIKAFLAIQTDNTIFQSPDFYILYHSVKNYSPTYYLLYDSEVLKGLLLAVSVFEGNGLVSRLINHCIIQGGPIVQDDNPVFIDLLLKELTKTTGKNTILTQFRNYRVWDDKVVEVFNKNGFELHDHLNLIHKNTSPEETIRGMSSSRRRQIRKGLESGAILKTATSIAEVKELYDLLYILYRDSIRKPLPAWPFFEEFYNQLVLSGKGVILLVYFNEKVIGGIVSPITPGKMMYELYICGLYKEYPNQYPNVLATWGALDWAAKNNIPAFDFLGLGKPEIPYGVRDFKLRFGGEQLNYGRFGRRNHRLMYAIAEMGYKVMRRF